MRYLLDAFSKPRQYAWIFEQLLAKIFDCAAAVKLPDPHPSRSLECNHHADKLGCQVQVLRV